MAQVSFSPPFTTPADVASQLQSSGFAVLSPEAVAEWVGCDLSALLALNSDWAALPPDEFLKDGGRYRRRRHACFVLQEGRMEQVPHRGRPCEPAFVCETARFVADLRGEPLDRLAEHTTRNFFALFSKAKAA